MLERPRCLQCETKLSYRELVTEFKYTYTFGSKKYNVSKVRIWICKKCRVRIADFIDKIRPLIESIFGDK